MIVIRIPAKPKEEKAQKLRVAAYCRVSSAEPDQIASLESQVYYYERKIKSNKGWLYRGVYYDVGSGLRMEQRKGLAKVLKQAEKGRIDLILTKSVSRLARNTVDVLEATRMLKDKGVDIIFENEKLKLSDQQTERSYCGQKVIDLKGLHVHKYTGINLLLVFDRIWGMKKTSI